MRIDDIFIFSRYTEYREIEWQRVGCARKFSHLVQLIFRKRIVDTFDTSVLMKMVIEIASETFEGTWACRTGHQKVSIVLFIEIFQVRTQMTDKMSRFYRCGAAR